MANSLVKNQLPAEGAWWLRDQWKNGCPSISERRFRNDGGRGARQRGRAALRLAKDGRECQLVVDHVIAGSGYDIDVERLEFIHPKLRCAIPRLERAPRLNAIFETSVSGLHFICPASAMSFGPLFRFVFRAEYSARAVSAHLAARALSAA
jgi:hypothetical protein